MTSTSLKIFIAVNHEGEFTVTQESADDAIHDLHDNYNCDAVRTIALNVTVDLPVIETIPVTVPAQEHAPTQVTVADQHGEI